jgi:hypothetical protein
MNGRKKAQKTQKGKGMKKPQRRGCGLSDARKFAG